MIESLFWMIYDVMLALCWPVILLAAVAISIRLLWSTWTGADGWRHEREMRKEKLAQEKIETSRQRMNAGLVTVTPGTIVIDRADLRGFVAAQLQIALAAIDANRTHAQVPQNVHYAPHMIGAKENGSMYAQIEEQPRMLPAPTDFWSLYHQGALPEHGFLMGFSLDDGHAVTADWRKLYSALIGGQSGSGKSTLVRSILAQSALQGGRFVVIDPHAGSGDESLAESLSPLRRLMLCEPASTDGAIRDALRFVESVGRARLAGQNADKSPLILVVDELTGLLTRGNVGDDLLRTLGLIAQETRKVGVYALAIGQQFQAELFPSQVRNAFVSYLSCRARKDTAKVMSGSTEFGKMAADLTIGQAVWMTPAGETERLSVPNTTQKHLTLIARQIQEGRYSAEPAGLLPEVERVTDQVTNRVTDQVTNPAAWAVGEPAANPASNPAGNPGDARAARVAQMLDAGATFTEIVRQVWNVEGKGPPYQAALGELRGLIASSMRR